MTVYIEYAIIENFFYDFILLLCAYTLSKTPFSWWKITLSALFGGVFAVVYPLLSLPYVLSALLKICVGLLLVLIGISKKGRSRYGLGVFFFFVCAFCFAGGLYAFGKAYILPCFCLFAVITVKIGKTVYRKMRFSGNLRACKLFYQGKEREALGYLDSGNLARQKGLPVCFITAKLFLDIYDEDRGQVFDEMRIQTLAGEKKVPVFFGEISIDGKEKKPVYLGVSGNIIKRGYEILLNGEMEI